MFSADKSGRTSVRLRVICWKSAYFTFSVTVRPRISAPSQVRQTFSMIGRSTSHAASTMRGECVRAFAETLQDLVAALIAQGLRDQKNLILRQRFASRFRHPHTFEHDRFKLKRSCSLFYRRRDRRHKGVIIRGLLNCRSTNP